MSPAQSTNVFSPGVVIVPEHHVPVAVPALVEFAETTVAVAVRLSFAVFLPEQLQRQVFVSLKLAVQFGEIQTRPGLPMAVRSGRFGNRSSSSRRSSKSSGNGHVSFGGRGLFQIPMNGRLADRATAGDLVLVQAQTKTQRRTSLILRIDNRFWGNQLPPLTSGREPLPPLLSSAALLLMKFFSENHSGDVNNHSGRAGFFIHLAPESIFTSRRNPLFTSLRNDYSHAPESAAGQFRGQPWLTSVLAKLYELEQYTDAEIARKKAAAMITGFIKQVSQDNPVMTPDQTVAQAPADPGTQVTKLEPNTFINLGFGEEVQFAQVPETGDYRASSAPVCRLSLPERAWPSTRSVATSRGSTTPRSALVCCRSGASASSSSTRCSCFRFATRSIRRWLREAMLAMVFGVDLLNAYDKDPEPFEAAQWVTPGWPWVDPEKDIKAAERAIRDGLSTRTIECAAQGYDASCDRPAAEGRQRPRRPPRPLLRLGWQEDPYGSERRG